MIRPIALVIAVWLGAYAAIPIPLYVLTLLGLLLLFVRHIVIFILFACALTTTWSACSWNSLNKPLLSDVSTSGVLISDPEYKFGHFEAEAKMANRSYLIRVKGVDSIEFSQWLSGYRVHVTGKVKSLPQDAQFLRYKHIAGLVEVDSLYLISPGVVHMRLANTLRLVLMQGVHHMQLDKSALFTGLIYGDDRKESREHKEVFKESGLSHLLAVSGQNVAFVLLAISPLINRFQLKGRLIFSLIVLFIFCTMTRFEPSVLRAGAMATVVLLARFKGTQIDSFSTLAIASSVCVMIDPLLINSVGLLLSISACLGMIILGDLLSGVLLGPTWFRQSIGFTAAAQFGTAPIQCAVFGGSPLIAIVTNPLVEPAAAFVMIWGISIGFLAGMVQPLSPIFHLPTQIAIDWIILVATKGASAELGNWTWTSLWICTLMLCWLQWLRHK